MLWELRHKFKHYYGQYMKNNMNKILTLLEEERKLFDETFSPEWWKGFGRTDDIDKQGIEGLKSFLLASHKRVLGKACRAYIEETNLKQDHIPSLDGFMKWVEGITDTKR